MMSAGVALSSIATSTVRARSHAEAPVVMPMQASMCGVRCRIRANILAGQLIEIQALANGRRQGEPEDATAVVHDEVDRFRRHPLCRDYAGRPHSRDARRQRAQSFVPHAFRRRFLRWEKSRHEFPALWFRQATGRPSAAAQKARRVRSKSALFMIAPDIPDPKIFRRKQPIWFAQGATSTDRCRIPRRIQRRACLCRCSSP